MGVMDKLLLTPLFQYGFLGLSGVLLCILIWRMKADDTSRENISKVLQENTRVITAVMDLIRESERHMETIHKRIDKVGDDVGNIRERIIECTSRKG